jgi:hypothetical protein
MNVTPIDRRSQCHARAGARWHRRAVAFSRPVSRFDVPSGGGRSGNDLLRYLLPRASAREDERVHVSRLQEDIMESIQLLDCAGRRRSPATMSSFHAGLRPRNKGLRYPADPPTVEEIVAVMRVAGDSPEGVRLRGIVVVLWRAGLRPCWRSHHATCAGSTTPRSSLPSTDDQHP